MISPKAPGAKCHECTLRDRPCVPTFGPAKVDLIVIGEAPGREEVRTGEPFKPRQSPPNAGYILWECFRQLGIERNQVGITNSVLCHPEGNRNPESSEVAACNDRLLQEVLSREPKVVLALGNFAARALLKSKQGVGTLRAQDHTIGGVPLVVTYHPAALFRMGSLFQDFAADLERASRLLKEGKPTAPEVKYVVPKTLDDLRLVFRHAAKDVDGRNSVDIETSHFNPTVGYVVCNGIAWKTGPGEYRAAVIPQELLEDPLAQDLINKHLARYSQVYHNAAFDVAFLRHHGFDARVGDDTMLMSYALDERRGIHGLEILAKTYCSAPNWKQQFLDPYLRSSKTSYATVPRPALHAYNACDAYYTRRLRDALWDQMDDTLRNLYTNLMVPASGALINMTVNGLKIDIAYASELDATYAQRMSEHLGVLTEAFGKDFNPNSPKQVQEAMRTRGFILSSTRKELLEELPDEMAGRILSYRHLSKMRSTYINGFVNVADERDRVHPGYKQYDTTTGRLAAQNPPIQTVPREKTERDLFVAEEGWKLVACDFGSNEYRCVAYLSEDPFLHEVFTRGVDLHKEAADLYLKGFRIPSGMDARTVAKMINFGLLYGRGAWSLSLQLGVTQSEAEKMIDAYFDRMPLVLKFMETQRKAALETGMIETVFGRRRRFGLVTTETAKEITKQAYNFPVQSLGSDLCLHALIALDKALDPKVAFPVTILHDAIVVEAREDKASEVARTVEDIMLSIPGQHLKGLRFPWEVECAIVDRWGEAKKAGKKRLGSVPAAAIS